MKCSVDHQRVDDLLSETKWMYAFLTDLTAAWAKDRFVREESRDEMPSTRCQTKEVKNRERAFLDATTQREKVIRP